jgi:hypothetical protein
LGIDAGECPEERAIDMGIETLWRTAMSGSTGSSRPPRHLLIISRYHPGLFEYVRARFASEDNVQVILDRRRGRDRRAAANVAGAERRRSDRRVRPHVDAALRMESMQFVTIAPGSGGILPHAPGIGPTDRSL